MSNLKIKNSKNNIFKKLSLFLLFLLSVFVVLNGSVFALIVPRTANSGKESASRLTGGSTANEIDATAKKLISNEGIDLLKWLFDKNSCINSDFKDQEVPPTNMSSSKYVPITSDKIEISVEETNRNTQWLFMKECLYDRAAKIMQAQFLAKLSFDAEQAMREGMFAGTSAFLKNYNAYMQEASDTIVKDIIYNNANIENMCSPHINAVKVALNDKYARRNKNDLGYLIGNSKCDLDDDGTASGNQHQAGFEKVIDPSNGDWETIDIAFGSNIHSLFRDIEKDAQKAVDAAEESKKNHLSDDGMLHLQRCRPDSPDPSLGTPVGTNYNQANTYYRTSITGEGGTCEIVNVAGLIGSAYSSMMDTNNDFAFLGEEFTSTMGKMLSTKAAYFPSLNSEGLLEEKKLATAYGLVRSGLEHEIDVMADSYIGTIAGKWKKELSDWEIIKELIEDVTGVSLDKIDELGSCLTDLEHKHGLNMNAIFDVDSALEIKDAIEKGLKELREHEKEYNRFVEAAKKDIDDLEKEAKNNQENLDDLGQKIRAIEKTVEEHKYHNIKEEIELYIEEKIDGAEETSIKALTEACKKSL